MICYPLLFLPKRLFPYVFSGFSNTTGDEKHSVKTVGYATNGGHRGLGSEPGLAGYIEVAPILCLANRSCSLNKPYCRNPEGIP